MLEKILTYSELKILPDRISYLMYPDVLLTECTIQKNTDNVVFSIDTSGLNMSDNIDNLSKNEKLRFLINCFSLLDLRERYSFSINPENIAFDLNLCPKIILRDDISETNDFINEYKALIGTIMYPKYNFNDYYNGGKDLYKKHSFLKKIKAAKDAAQIKEILVSAYENDINYIKKNKILILKKGVILYRIFIPLLIVITIAVCIRGFFVLYVESPVNRKLLAAADAFIAEDYLLVESELSSIECSKIPYTEKYILAWSSILTENLTPEQKENILSGITLKTDPIVLSYWIELGRLNFDESIDYAQRLNDDEMLLFALIKKCADVKSDTAITGEEKSSIVSALEKQINDLKNKIDANQSALDLNKSTS